jgi:hypothetical protein
MAPISCLRERSEGTGAGHPDRRCGRPAVTVVTRAAWSEEAVSIGAKSNR